MKKYKLIIFDIDGTLFDTSEGIIASVKYALKYHNLSLDDSFDYSFFIGPPIQNSFKELFPNLSEEQIKELSLTFRNEYKDHNLFLATPYQGLYEALETIYNNDIKIAVGTYKREDYAYDIVDHFQITKYTKNIHGQDFAGLKSKADILKDCLLEAGVDSEDALMIGDTNSDGDAANKNNIDFLEVTFGFGFSKTKHYKGNNVGFINNYDELKKYLNID